MGVCTRALLKGKINPEEIANFILNYYNLEPNEIRVGDIFADSVNLKETNLNPVKQYGEKTDFWNTDCTHIVFVNPFINSAPKNTTSTHRSLFWYYTNSVFKGDDDTEIALQNETTYISLGYDNDAIEIIKTITAHFGGWMDENNCDDVGYIEVDPEGSEAKNKEIKPIFYFTIEDLQKHFDGIVKIVSKEEKEKLIKKKIEMKKLTPSTP